MVCMSVCVCVFVFVYVCLSAVSQLIFIPVAYRVGLRVPLFVLAQSSGNTCWRLFFFCFSFPAWIFSSLALDLFWNQLLRQTLTDTLLVLLLRLDVMSLLKAGISIFLAHSSPLQPHNMMQGRKLPRANICCTSTFSFAVTLSDSFGTYVLIPHLIVIKYLWNSDNFILGFMLAFISSEAMLKTI